MMGLAARFLQMSPHLSGYIHPQSHNSLVKNRIYDNQKSFKHSQLWAKLSLNLYNHLQNAASRGAREMEVPPLLPKMSASTTSLATRIVTMVSGIFFRILYHVGQSTLCEVIMVRKQAVKVSTMPAQSQCRKWEVRLHGLTFGWHFRQILQNWDWL